MGWKHCDYLGIGRGSNWDCNYKNCRIFTLRWIHKVLVPVSIRLKTTLRTEKARKIIRTVEKQLLQARINSINSILDNNAKQRELCRSKLALILSTSNFRKCQEFFEKVSELRFNKVKSRQVNKLNNSLSKKEGNITWESSQATRATPQAVILLPQDRTASQEASTVHPNITLSWEDSANSADSQGGPPQDSTASQEASMAPITTLLPRKLALTGLIPR